MRELQSTLGRIEAKRRWLPMLGALFVFIGSPPQLRAQKLALSADVKPPIAVGHKAALRETVDRYQLDLRYQDEPYRLCPSDVISLTFPFAPSLNQTLTVQPDGSATLAEVGNLHLEGLTTQEAVQAIQSGYARILDDPVVAVELRDFNRPYFIVTGEVNKPGKYDLRGFTSVSEALALAGGFSDAAKRSPVLLFRRAGNEWYEVKPLNLKRLFQGRDLTEDVELRAGDMLVVSATTASRIKRLLP